MKKISKIFPIVNGYQNPLNFGESRIL